MATGMSLVGAVALAACSSASGGEAGDSAGGVARVAISQDVSPAVFYAGDLESGNAVRGLAYNTLTRYDLDSLDPQPELATDWEISPDGLEYTLTLRDDVTFHDGRELTSEDVRTSLEEYADPSHAGQLASTAAQITEFDTSDPHSLGLTLNQPVNNLFDLFQIVPIIDSTDIDGFHSGENYNGTGAFRLTEWQKGTKLEFEANPDYWDGAPLLDGVEALVVSDPQTRISQLRSGQLDLLPSVSPRDRRDLESDSDFQIQVLPGVNNPTYAGFNVTVPGLDDVRVRKAIAYAVDRDRILEEAYQGYGTTLSLPWPEQSPAYDAEKNATFDRDPDSARELVAEVGDIPPIAISYTTSDRQSETVAQIVADNLADAGITVELAGLESGTAISHLRNGTFPGIWIINHTFTQYTPSTLVTSAFPFNEATNGSNFSDPGYTAAVREAWGAQDPHSDAAREAYSRINDALLEHVFLTELIGVEVAAVSTSELRGAEWTKRTALDLSNASFSE